MTLNRNPENYFAQIEQATFAPSNFVPGIAASPDKMLLARIFSYADAHRYRVGTNHAQLPVNVPKTEVHTTRKTEPRATTSSSATTPVYAPNSVGGPRRSTRGARQRLPAGRATASSCARPPTLHAEDDDFGQAGTLVREVLDDAARDRLVAQHRRPRLEGDRPDLPRARLRVLDERRRRRSVPAWPPASSRAPPARTRSRRPWASARSAPIPRACRSLSLSFPEPVEGPFGRLRERSPGE